MFKPTNKPTKMFSNTIDKDEAFYWIQKKDDGKYSIMLHSSEGYLFEKCKFDDVHVAILKCIKLAIENNADVKMGHSLQDYKFSQYYWVNEQRKQFFIMFAEENHNSKTTGDFYDDLECAAMKCAKLAMNNKVGFKLDKWCAKYGSV